MIRIYFLAFVICSGVLLPISCDVITLMPHEIDQERTDGEDYSVSCEAKDAEKIQWLNPKNQVVSNTRRSDNVYVEEKPNMSQLRFHPLSTSHAGEYTCVVKIRGYEYRKSFKLTVIKSIQFKDKLREYHALAGSSETLYCEVESNPPAQISWTFNETAIEGNGYIILADGLQVNNVTTDKLGNYTCTASIITDKNGFSKSISIALKEAIPPKIISNYKNNTVHGIIDNIVSIRCPVVAEPYPEMKWVRNNRELNAGQLNANITNTPSGSILQFVMTKEHLGNYTCKAANKFNSTSETFFLEEGVMPSAPTVYVRDTLDKEFRFDITPNSSEHDLSNYRVTYKKLSEDDSAWKTRDFGLKDSLTNPYSINDLEPETEYLYKVGACSQDDMCTFTNVTKITTQKLAATSTNTANTIHTVVTQMLILLPAFILGLMQRHRTT